MINVFDLAKQLEPIKTKEPDYLDKLKKSGKIPFNV